MCQTPDLLFRIPKKVSCLNGTQVLTTKEPLPKLESAFPEQVRLLILRGKVPKFSCSGIKSANSQNFVVLWNF